MYSEQTKVFAHLKTHRVLIVSLIDYVQSWVPRRRLKYTNILNMTCQH